MRMLPGSWRPAMSAWCSRLYASAMPSAVKVVAPQREWWATTFCILWRILALPSIRIV
jgi:hypothetical protein